MPGILACFRALFRFVEDTKTRGKAIDFRGETGGFVCKLVKIIFDWLVLIRQLVWTTQKRLS